MTATRLYPVKKQNTHFAASLNQFCSLEMPLIIPAHSLNGVDQDEMDAYAIFIEKLLWKTIPHPILQQVSQGKGFESLMEQVPLLSWNIPDKAPSTLSVNLLCHSDYTSGVGRFACDTLSRWLVPGKFLNICSVRSLSFRFSDFPEQLLFFQQMLLDISDERELLIIKNMREQLEKEIRLNILAVKHARHIIAIKKLSSDQKKAIIAENIASVLHRPSKDLDNNVFDQMHNFFVHLNNEDKIGQIQEQFTPFLNQKPKIFDRDIFKEIKHSVSLFGDKFTAHRTLRHVSRLISLHFLFRKTLAQIVHSSPKERHISLKILKTNKGAVRTLGILGTMNVLRDNELFEERHILEAVSHCQILARPVPNSFLLDLRSHDPIRSFYIEIEKQGNSSFSLEEIKELQKHLPRELKEGVESFLHPVLMPRNEEEIMRNILLLSNQLKYVGDIPQVIISFDTQTEHELRFTVILLRALKGNEPPLSEIFFAAQTDLKINNLEQKRAGLLRKKYLKEANLFTVAIDKKKYLRKDFSLDLFKARQAVSNELCRIFGGIRDFNGGILSKQQEVYKELRFSLENVIAGKDFLLENFYYSVTPPLQGSLLSPNIFKTLFLMMLEALEGEKSSLKLQQLGDHLLIMAASPDNGMKEELFSIVTLLQIPTADLSYTYVSAYGVNCLGYIYHNHDAHIMNSLLNAFRQWHCCHKD